MIDAIKTKLVFALKSNGFGIEKMDMKANKNGSFVVGIIITNDKACEIEEVANVIKEDYRIRQIDETSKGTT